MDDIGTTDAARQDSAVRGLLMVLGALAISCGATYAGLRWGIPGFAAVVAPVAIAYFLTKQRDDDLNTTLFAGLFLCFWPAMLILAVTFGSLEYTVLGVFGTLIAFGVLRALFRRVAGRS